MNWKTFARDCIVGTIGGIASTIGIGLINKIPFSGFFSHTTIVNTWMIIALSVIVVVIITALIRKFRIQKKIVSNLIQEHNHRIEVIEFNNNSNITEFLKRQTHLNNEIAQYKNKEAMEMTVEDKMVYAKIKNSAAWRSLDVLRRAKDGDNCKSYDPNHLQLFVNKSLILPSMRLTPGVYTITNRGLRFLAQYSEDIIKSQPSF